MQSAPLVSAAFAGWTLPLRTAKQFNRGMVSTAAGLGAVLRTCSVLVLSLGGALSAQVWVDRGLLYSDENAIAYDSHRSRAVQVVEDGTRSLVFEWDGLRWTFCEPAGGIHPIAGWERSLVYDSVRHRTLFAGLPDPDLWAWDGATWTSLGPPPFLAGGRAMAFDSMRDRLVVFERTSYMPPTSRTWEYDGTTWQQMQPSVQPDTVSSASMVYDRSRARMVMVGDVYQPSGWVNRTWEWYGANWHATAPTVLPTGGQRLVFDAVRNRVILPTTGTTMWEWNGTNWTPFATPSVGTDPNHPGYFFYDEGRTELLLSDAWTRTTRRLGAGGWSIVDEQPGWGSSAAAADYSSSCVIAVTTPFFGPDPLTTWRWDGYRWSALGNQGLPARVAAALADRDFGGSVYWFGGVDPSNVPSDELWAWNGATWNLVAVPYRPAPRHSGSLTVDTLRNRLVSFGGYSTWYLNDTWEFDGQQWWPRYPAHAPSPRLGMQTCFDPRLGKVFLFGGRAAPTGTLVNDFHAWDGTDWTALPAPSTPLLHTFDLAFHPGLQRTILTGKNSQTETWAWDGAVWIQLQGGMLRDAIVTDPIHSCVLAYQSTELLTTQPATSLAYGLDCAGSMGAPTLRSFGAPALGNDSFAFDLHSALPGSLPALLVYGLQSATSPLPSGCTLNVAPISIEFTVVTAGIATVGLPIPPDLSLRGVAIFVQGALLDAATPAGYATTRGLQCTIGD